MPRPRQLPERARCEVCGQTDSNLLRRVFLRGSPDPEWAVLCHSHAAPLGLRGPVHRDGRSPISKTELLVFWAERRPGIAWLSNERRSLRDRRDARRFELVDRRRAAR